MARYTIVFHGGPCAGIRTTTTQFDKPPDFIRCRGAAYTLDPRRSTTTLWYSYEQPDPDQDAAYTRGRRDALRAWNRLMRAIGQGTEREIKALNTARAKIRKAVR